MVLGGFFIKIKYFTFWILFLVVKLPPKHSLVTDNKTLFSLLLLFSVICTRIRSGPDSIRTHIRRPQPADGLIRGADSTARRSTARSQCVWQRTEPQRTGLPPVSTLTATSEAAPACKIRNENKQKKSQGKNVCSH